MIFIRTSVNSSNGIGHLMRMLHLAKEFSNQGHVVSFLLDEHQLQITKHIEDFNTFYLYSSSDISNFSETEDARRCLEILDTESVDHVIVDDYRLSRCWEDIIVANGYKTAVFDDMCDRPHNCDFIIDPKWCGALSTFKRYQDLVPGRCKRLLGPGFCILDEQYRSEKVLGNSQRFNILFSIGGGGDLSLISKLLENLIALADENDRSFCLLPVIGPLASNSQKIFEVASTDSRIQPVTNATSLYPYYINTSLFVGALGTSLYELSALFIPALTFSLSPNQENVISDLEDFGHYLHLSTHEEICPELLAPLIWILREQIHRVQKLRERSRINIDGYGTERIVEVLGGSYNDEHKSNMFQTSNSGSRPLDLDYIKLTDDLSIREVIDTDINHYLDSRNLEQNMTNMINASTISRLEHYIWWFTSNNDRDSYVLEKNQVPQLFIWHQLLSYCDRSYWIGGWFVCTAECSFNIVVAALKWQLDFTHSLNPDTTWIAVIKKTNNYVNLLNKYMGFENVNGTSHEFHAIRQFFEFASTDEYNYVKFSPSTLKVTNNED